MSRRRLSQNERGLGERLRQEAIDSWPAYSEALHNRIVDAIEQRQTNPKPAAPNRRLSDARRSVRWMGALAAACLVGLVVLGWPSNQREQGNENTLASAATPFDVVLPTKVVVETLVPGVSVDDQWTDVSMEELGGLAISAALAPHSDDLKHDTRLAAETLLERLPIDMELFVGPE